MRDRGRRGNGVSQLLRAGWRRNRTNARSPERLPPRPGRRALERRRRPVDDEERLRVVQPRRVGVGECAAARVRRTGAGRAEEPAAHRDPMEHASDGRKGATGANSGTTRSGSTTPSVARCDCLHAPHSTSAWSATARAATRSRNSRDANSENLRDVPSPGARTPVRAVRTPARARRTARPRAPPAESRGTVQAPSRRDSRDRGRRAR